MESFTHDGWKFDVTGQCIEIPSEPEESRLMFHLIAQHTLMLHSSLGSLESAADSLQSLQDTIVQVTRSLDMALRPIHPVVPAGPLLWGDRVGATHQDQSDLAAPDAEQQATLAARIEAQVNGVGFRGHGR